MKLDLPQLKKHFKDNQKEILDEFFTFLRFDSISTDPQYSKPIHDCADWLKQKLMAIGLKVESWEEGNHPPILFATDMSAGPNAPTLLIYNHYDVQPVDPWELWQTQPFEPEIKDGEIYARGAVDDKGQCFYVMEALKMLKQTLGSLPINIKYLIEGEEECGSELLTKMLPQKKQQLQADYALIVDTGMHAKNKPAITLGVRGLVCFTLKLKASHHDLHSGEHGGLAYNPNRALTELLANLFDKDGSITIPGFYNQVEKINTDDLSAISFDFDDEHYHKTFGIPPNGGEKGYKSLEKNWLRPTLEINGISGGYSGEGFKTVIPAMATAKISCRLVPNQDPEVIVNLLKKYFDNHVPEGMHLEFYRHPGGGPALRTNPHSKLANAATGVFTEVFGIPCQRIFNGASIPIVAELGQASNAELLLIGMGLPNDQIHAPNEHFGIDRLELGYLVMAKLIQTLGK